MKLYMIRHGQSAANAQRLHAGWAQVPLTEQGIRKAALAGRLLRDISFDQIYVSDLIRAQQTLAAALPDATAVTTPLLREIGVGDLAGKSAAECLQLYGDSYLENKAVQNFVPYGGENAAMHLDRIRDFSKGLEKKPHQSVAAFCHEGSIRCMLDLVLGYRHDRKERSLDNGSVTIFEYENGTWSLVSWNQMN